MGAYWRPQMGHAVSSLPIPAPHETQIRPGPSSWRNSSNAAARWDSVDPPNSTPQKGQVVVAVPTNEPHSGQRNRWSAPSP